MDQKKGAGTGMVEPGIPSGKPTGRKWVAIVVALIITVAALSIIDFYKQSPRELPQIIVSGDVASTAGAYNFTVITNGKFINATFHFGDGTEAVKNYSGVNGMEISHRYANPGKYYIYFTVNYGSWVYSGTSTLIPVTVTIPSISPEKSVGLITPEQSNATPSVSGTSQPLYNPGNNVTLLLGYYTPPSASNYEVIEQHLGISRYSRNITSLSLPYAYNSTSGSYELPPSMSTYSFSGASDGVYAAALTTSTAYVNSSTGAINSSRGSFNTTYIFDIPVFTNGGVIGSGTAKTVFVNAKLQKGGYYSLDPAIQYDLVSEGIDLNTLQTLVFYNGSSTSSYRPYLSSSLPTIGNGGINANYANYTVKASKSDAGFNGSYVVHIKPFENYTFHIRSNASWQDGSPVTAWDVMYSLARLLLFEDGSPGTSGFILGQYVLPGNYYDSISYWNITQNITVDNATNSITIHFQTPMSPNLAYQSLTYAWITSASWLESHGAGIQWTPAGFMAYESQGNAANYNIYVENHVFSDGPYQISYIVPSSKVVLVKNPYFTAPGSWYPAPSIDKVTVDYVNSPGTVYLQMKSGDAQTGQVPSSSWNSAEILKNEGAIKIYNFPSATINFYNFNANVNGTILKTIDSGSNFPFAMFSSLNARRAFAYSYNYNEYFGYQVGNSIYNTSFRTPYAGALPPGTTFSQNITELNSTTGGAVPYFNQDMARAYWNAFANSSGARSAGISWTGSAFSYNGKPMDLPIFVLDTYAADVAGASTWASDLEKVIPGLSVQVVQISLSQLIGYLVQGQNPLPIYDWSTTPTYPYPTYNLITNALPDGNSYYPSANSMIPAWLSSQSNNLRNTTQAAMLSNMISMFNNGTGNYSNPQVAMKWFQQMNEELINMTMYVYTGQTDYHLLMSPAVSATGIAAYQENPLIGGGGILMYNLLSYT